MKIAIFATVAAVAIVVFVLVEGDGDDDSPPDATRPQQDEQALENEQTLAEFSPREKVERTGNEWARLVAASDDTAACNLMTQPACGRLTCESISGSVQNCSPPSPAFRESFRDATVEDVAIRGVRAGARFSNGETVLLFRREGPHLADPEIGASWLIDDVGGQAGRGLLGGD